MPKKDAPALTTTLPEPDVLDVKTIDYKVFAEKVVQYFRLCIENKKLPQLAGLLVKLGISRDDWAKLRERHPKVVNRANHFIEQFWVEKLLESNATGAMFYLKNTFKDIYRDKTESDINIRIPKPILEGVEPIKATVINTSSGDISS